MWEEIIEVLGTEDSRHQRLRRFRTKILGSVPKGSDDFSHQSLLEKIKRGREITVMDSNKDLPPDWVSQCTGSPTEAYNVEEDPNDNDDSEKDHNLPKRVLVFTMVFLLQLFNVCSHGSVDGTFKAISRGWKQLFIIMLRYGSPKVGYVRVPVAFGWLPDKSELSYQVFVLLH